MPDSVKGVAGPGDDRTVSPVEAAMEARERRAQQMREEKLRAERAERAAEGASSSRAPAQAAGVPEPQKIPPYRVQLDPGTKHLYTEVLNTTTGEVVLRIPQGYVDPQDILDPEMPPGRDGQAGTGEVKA